MQTADNRYCAITMSFFFANKDNADVAVPSKSMQRVSRRSSGGRRERTRSISSLAGMLEEESSTVSPVTTPGKLVFRSRSDSTDSYPSLMDSSMSLSTMMSSSGWLTSSERSTTSQLLAMSEETVDGGERRDLVRSLRRAKRRLLLEAISNDEEEDDDDVLQSCKTPSRTEQALRIATPITDDDDITPCTPTLMLHKAIQLHSPPSICKTHINDFCELMDRQISVSSNESNAAATNRSTE